jgi:lysophospholipase L1-like esterase
MKRLFNGVLAVCGAGLVVALAASGSAAAAVKLKPLPLVPGSGYLALGDSVTFGYQESNVVPAPNYRSAANFPGYPELVGAALRLRVANAACPGETSSSLINASAISNGCENTVGKPVGYRRSFPLHVKYSGSQLAYAVSYLKSHHDVRLVSLMIGANDYFACQETTKDGCTSASELAALLQKITTNVKTILSTIRSKAGYTGQIAIQNYYSLDYASAVSNGQSEALNAAVDGAAKPFGVVITSSYEVFQTAALHSAQGDDCTAGLLTQLSTGKCGVHPSYAGQALLAQAMEDAVKL